MPGKGLSVLAIFSFVVAVENLPSAGADNFYEGKTIELTVPARPGGDYDRVARIIAQYLPRQIPGTPKVVLKYTPSSLAATAAIFGRKVQDGTALLMPRSSILIDQLLGSQQAEYNADRFKWLGSSHTRNFVLMANVDFPVESIEDLKGLSLTIAATGKTSANSIVPRLAQMGLGWKSTKIISGYAGASGRLHAIQKGEVNSTVGTWDVFRSLQGAELGPDKWNPVFQLGMQRQTGLEKVPLLSDLVSKDVQPLVRIYDSFGAVGYGLVAPPLTPTKRVETLRQAYSKMNKDTEFIQVMNKAGLPVTSFEGNGLQKFVANFVDSTNPETIAKLRTIVASGDENVVRGDVKNTSGVRTSGGYFWNSWLSHLNGPNERPLDSIVVEKYSTYDVVIDISAFDYSNLNIGSAATQRVRSAFRDRLKEIISTGQRVLPLKARVVAVGKEIQLVPGSTSTIRLVIDLSKLEQAAPPKGSETLEEISARVSGATLRIPVKALERGCGALAVSFWMDDDPVPLDHLIRIVPVSSPDNPVKQDDCYRKDGRSIALRGGMNTLLEKLLVGASMERGIADAGLHVFEESIGGLVSSVAVYVDGADRDPSDQPKTYAWQTTSPLTRYLQEPGQLFVKITAARDEIRRRNRITRGTPGKTFERHAYHSAAEEMARKLFSSDRNQTEADMARKAISRLAKAPGKDAPVLIARLISSFGRPMYMPLGILSATHPEPTLDSSVVVMQPLPRESYSNRSACVRPWTFAIPQKLHLAPADEENALRDFAAPSWIEQRLSNVTALVNYLRGAVTGGNDGEGLLLLAHHDGGNLYYEKPPDRAIREDIKREFRAGSMAVLTACSILDVEQHNLGLLERLNGQGIDGFIASPFAVEAAYGVQFAMAFARVLDRERTEGSQPTLATLLVEATKETSEYYASKKELFHGQMDVEFMIVGDPNIRLCLN